MEIAIWSGFNALGLFVDNLGDIEILFHSASPQVLKFFENCFQTTPHCREVDTVEWKAGQESGVFALDASKVDEKRANNYLKENVFGKIDDKDKQNKQINLKMLSFG